MRRLGQLLGGIAVDVALVSVLPAMCLLIHADVWLAHRPWTTRSPT